MKVFLDHNMPVQVAEILGVHTVVSTKERSWQLVANGNLLRAAAAEGFEVFLTADKDFRQYEHDRERLISIVQFSTSHLPSLRVAHESILQAVEHSAPGSYAYVLVPLLQRRKRLKAHD